MDWKETEDGHEWTSHAKHSDSLCDLEHDLEYKGGLLMKNAVKHLARALQEAEPGAKFSFECWDGERLNNGNEPAVLMRLKSEESAARLLGDGFLGFGEAYMAGDLEVEGDLQELLRLGIAARFDQKEPSFWKKLRLLPSYLKCKNSVRRAPLNISHHYDLGDDFYALYLDTTMAYSCAYFKNGDDSLEQAQQNKYEHIARKLMLSPGDRLVDIGCGWGGMLIHAAKRYGVNGLGNTISRRQYEYANRKIEELGLQDQIEVVMEDYRDLKGQFDKLVSIGMFEHVGKEYIPSFMKKASELLTRGGLGLLHTIGKETESPGDPWTQRYIFPGSYLPNLPEVAHHMGRARLSILDVENLRLHYARTLDCWARNFEKAAGRVRERFGETFARMWQLYLHASSAGFKYAETRLYQILFSNGLNNQLPMTREHVYSGRAS
jgi:cyclopropane-fatty-acyl-phospholipid synthase